MIHGGGLARPQRSLGFTAGRQFCRTGSGAARRAEGGEDPAETGSHRIRGCAPGLAPPEAETEEQGGPGDARQGCGMGEGVSREGAAPRSPLRTQGGGRGAPLQAPPLRTVREGPSPPPRSDKDTPQVHTATQPCQGNVTQVARARMGPDSGPNSESESWPRPRPDRPSGHSLRAPCSQVRTKASASPTGPQRGAVSDLSGMLTWLPSSLSGNWMLTSCSKRIWVITAPFLPMILGWYLGSTVTLSLKLRRA